MKEVIIGSVVFFLVLFVSLYLINTLAEITEPKQDTIFHNIWSQIVHNANIIFILLLLSIPTGFAILIYFFKS